LQYVKPKELEIMRTIYYVVERELQGVQGEFEEVTGNKQIRAYSCETNGLKEFFTIETTDEHNSIEEMQYWLDDNGYEDNEYNFELL
jgi:hypothetical protein